MVLVVVAPSEQPAVAVAPFAIAVLSPQTAVPPTDTDQRRPVFAPADLAAAAAIAATPAFPVAIVAYAAHA